MRKMGRTLFSPRVLRCNFETAGTPTMAASPKPVTELKVLTVNLGLLRMRVLGVKEVRTPTHNVCLVRMAIIEGRGRGRAWSTGTRAHAHLIHNQSLSCTGLMRVTRHHAVFPSRSVRTDD